MTKTHTSLRSLVESKTVEGLTKLTDFLIDPALIVIEPGWNGRDETPDLLEYRQRLKAAMKAGAAIPAVDVQMVDGAPVLRDGHSRTLMALELIAEGTPYKLQAREVKGNDSEMIFHMLGTGIGHAWSPLEMGRKFAVLIRHGETVTSIAARLGQHRSTVENGLKLAEMPAAVQKMVGTGKVASHTALKAVKAHGKEAAKVLQVAAKDAEAHGKSKVTPKAIATPKPKADGGRRKGDEPAPTVATPIPQPERAPVQFITLADGLMFDAPTVAKMRELLTRLAETPLSDKLAVGAIATETRDLLGL